MRLQQIDGERLYCASAQLVAGLEACRSSPEAGLALVKRLARTLGREPDGYPCLLKLLLVVAEYGNAEERRLLAQTLALGLRRGDLPSGSVSLWGGSTAWPANVSASAGLSALELMMAQTTVSPRRSLGPLEYLTAWRFQKTQHPPLEHAIYRRSMALLLDLLNQDASCRKLYPVHLRRVVDEAVDGQFTGQTRQALLRLADAWESESPAQPS
ncbi:MAG: hypothetical protein ACXIUM_12040 [Wenzhouxiangella sp.]